VLNVLPTNTPEEDAWVEAEGNTTDLAKVQRLVATPQYNRREVPFRCIGLKMLVAAQIE
jgi:hypothetical protein